ncbi:LytR/AlgR family response regulator transcription factor [Hymenobacter latericus]|uniref:LytR/AlgR family response regulator transcription factor n=1 Tax=Hymenobacter sp. YIM 151858-1 TaxID=2987688 RepID=UPI002226C179|nr:LytTR family DNA-binding domain-containing protein [Hymenobacter sp. YIM 151858-1]UYZ58218.1 LytTR family DNA-binding domain-containing protein [Hymenobacter sp. YIM 151858-1]
MRTLIIEDEQFAADILANLIQQARPDAQVLAMLGSVEESVEWLAAHQAPDVIFCDIHLSDGSSFEIFRQVEVKCPVIFTTAYNQYAIEAFKVNSVDYLLKPVQLPDVAQALRKYEESRKHYLADGLGNLQSLLQSFQAPQRQYRARFLVKNGQSIKVVPLHDIAYFQAEDAVVFLVTHEKKRFIVNFTLDQLEEQLDPQQFFRANRQYIVHINAVSEVKPYLKGRLFLQLNPAPAEGIFISSTRAASFKQWLDS